MRIKMGKMLLGHVFCLFLFSSLRKKSVSVTNYRLLPQSVWWLHVDILLSNRICLVLEC